MTDAYFDASVDEAAIVDILVAMEKESNHPLATAILKHFTPQTAPVLTVANELGRGLSANYQGQAYRIGKPSSFAQVKADFKAKEEALGQEGKTVVYMAVNEEVVGLIALMDLPNPAAKEAIDYFNREGIHTTMITGDAKLTGEAVGRMIGIQEVVANVMPEDKAGIVADQKTRFGTTAMLGDGVNDAPALVKADVGVAMGDGTDVAMDVADLVLMQNDLSKMVYAHRLAKKMDRITWQNIAFSMLVVLTLVTLNFLGKMDIAIGVIMHEGSTILVIINALRLLLTPREFK